MDDQITKLLAEVQAGDAGAKVKLASLVYADLHRMAAGFMLRERPGQTLQPTILVHDAFLRLLGPGGYTWQSRSHFFAVAAQVMRRILIDHARGRNAAKRGGNASRVCLEEIAIFTDEHWEDLIDVDRALDLLAEHDARLARVVELRFFAGMTEKEIGEVIGLSSRQVKRDWKVAKAWMYAELSGSKDRDRNGDGSLGTR